MCHVIAYFGGKTEDSFTPFDSAINAALKNLKKKARRIREKAHRFERNKSKEEKTSSEED